MITKGGHQEKEMKYKKKKPFLAQLLRLKFPEIVNNGVVMVWGNTIYGATKIPKDLERHEKVHIDQCKGSKLRGLIWWLKYVFSRKFRLNQEIEAYQKQYQYYCRKVKNKFKREEFLKRIATDLSGKLYGNLVSFGHARIFIKYDDYLV